MARKDEIRFIDGKLDELRRQVKDLDVILSNMWKKIRCDFLCYRTLKRKKSAVVRAVTAGEDVRARLLKGDDSPC